MTRREVRGEVLLPDGVAVGGVLAEVLEQLQQGQLDALLGGDVGVADQLVQSFSDVPRRVLQEWEQGMTRGLQLEAIRPHHIRSHHIRSHQHLAALKRLMVYIQTQSENWTPDFHEFGSPPHPHSVIFRPFCRYLLFETPAGHTAECRSEPF